MRILVVHPSLNPPGGGNAVAAWTIQALREEHDLTLLAWARPGLERINDYFGTSLRWADFRLLRIPRWLRRALDVSPTPSARLRHAVVARQARALLAREDFGLAISTQNEMDFGRRGMQYVHFPVVYLPRPDHDLRWYHRALPPALTAYRWLADRVAGASRESIGRNLTMVNSDWTGRRYRELYGAPATTVYPPVPMTISGRPWPEREDGFVCIGRISPEKRLETVIEILEAVRRRHPAVRLHLVGSPDHRAYARRILRLAAHRPWIDVHLDLPRGELEALIARNRYGIHGMVDEHFGIAVAELQRAGCVVFVPDDGGPVEIVGGDRRLLYGSPGEAIGQIDRLLGDAELRASVLAGVAARRGLFTAERFMDRVRELVAGFAS